MIDPVLGAKLVYILGYVNLVGLVLVFFSCRCLMGPKVFQKLIQKEWYKKFYITHCKWWYVFFVSVALHAILALQVYGRPF